MDVRNDFDQTETRPVAAVHRARGGSEWFKNIFSAVILGGAVAAAVLMYLFKPKPADKAPDSLIPQVRVAAVVPYAGDLDLGVMGTVVPHREVRLAAEVNGRVIEKSATCRAGSPVNEGDLLIVIDRENYELALKTAEAELSQATIMVEETGKELEGLRENVRLSKEQVQLLADEHQRNERLGEVVSRSELDQSQRAWLDARTQLSTRENTLATTLARVDRMGAALELAQRRVERAQLDLERTDVKAPFDGIVVRDLVEKDDFVQTGTPLVTIEDTRRVEVLCNLAETDLRWIRSHAPESVPGQTSGESGMQAAYQLPHLPVTISDPRDPTAVWTGRLDRFDGIGRDELTKAIPVRILVEEPVTTAGDGPRALVRGMFVRCGLNVEQQTGRHAAELIAFPDLAVRPGGFVWVVEGDRLRRVVVELVENAGGNSGQAIARVVEGGLKAGEQVVISPLSQPADGTIVRIEGATAEASATPVESEPAPGTGPADDSAKPAAGPESQNPDGL